MSGLMRRLTRRRGAEPEPAAGPPGAPEAAPAEPAGERSLLADPARTGSEEATERLPVTELPPPGPAAEPAAPATPTGDLPAGVDPDELANVPDSSARRGRLRRRLEFLRSAHELLLRDLGGFAYELHRTARDAEQEGHKRLRATKLARLDAVEAELHALERRLHDPRPHVIVREPGVGGECHRCGELFGSDANYCAHCGAPLTENARRARQKEEREPAAHGERPAAGAPAPEAPEAGTSTPKAHPPAADAGPAEGEARAPTADAGSAEREAPRAERPPPPTERAAPPTAGEAPPAADSGAPERNGAAPDARTRVRPPSSERPS